jgi:pimeloyl-ACP methyl ester carboxylesterase
VSGTASAPHWLLLRGLVREAGHWGTFLDRFRQAFPDSIVDTVDLPGCGRRHDETAPLTVREIADQVRARARLQPGMRTWVLGLSLGGMVALDWMARFPEEIAGGVILSSSAGGLGPMLGRCRPGGAVGLVRAALARSVERRERVVFALTSQRPELAPAAVPLWVDLAQQHPVRLASAARLLAAASRFRLPATAYWRPTLVLAGGGDRLVDPRCSRALAKSVGGVFQEHPTAGHDLPLDAPDWVIERVCAWQAGKL